MNVEANGPYLFAYGTLRKACKVDHGAAGNLLYVGKGSIQAQLYDLGEYPGAVKTGEGGEVDGEVFAVLSAEHSFAVLDAYEGDEFVREPATVHMDSGENINAWVYWYTGETQGLQPIPEKDYCIYLKTKDSLR